MVRSFTQHVLFMALLIGACTATMVGQIKVGTDIYSRYIWRGADLSAQSFQPAISYTAGSFSVGAWGSYAAAGGYAENDLWLSYAVGPVTLSLTDYYIPTLLAPTATFFDYNTNKGAGSHTVEVGAVYSGVEAFPITLSAYFNAIGGALDPDNSLYVQAAYPFTIESTTLTLTVGATPAKSTVWYTTADAGLINIGVAASKTIKITDDFSIPFNAQYILNAYAEKSYLMFGISL